MLEAPQLPPVRCYTMLHVQVPRSRKIRNDFCGGGGTISLNGGIGRAVIFKPHANELSTRIQLNRGLAELRCTTPANARCRDRRS